MFFHHIRASCLYVIFVSFIGMCPRAELNGESDKTDSSVAPKTIEIIEKKLPLNIVVNTSKSDPKSVQKYPYYGDNMDHKRIKDRLSRMTLLKKKTEFNIYHYQIDPKMDINSEVWSSPVNLDNNLANPAMNGSNNTNVGNVQNIQKRHSDKSDQNNLSQQNIRQATHSKNNTSYYSHRISHINRSNNKTRQATDNQNNYGYHNDKTSNNYKNIAYDNDRLSNNLKNTRQYPDDRFSNSYNSNEHSKSGRNIPRHERLNNNRYEIKGYENDKFHNNNNQQDNHLYTFSDRFISNLQKYQELIEELNEVLREEESKRIERDGNANKGAAKRTVAVSNSGNETAADEDSKAGEDFQEVLDFVAQFNITTGPPRVSSTGIPSRHWYKHVLDETALRRALHDDPYMQRIRKLYFMKLADYKRRVGGV